MKTTLISGSLLLFANVMTAQSWSINGNSGTTDGTHFLGTTDNKPFSIRVNNQKAGRIDHLTYNTFLGYQGGNAITTGVACVAIGYTALYSNTSGNGNTATGMQAMYANTTGLDNTANGAGALFSNTTGGHNTACGGGALTQATTGSYNTAVGASALTNYAGGSKNTALGASTDLAANNYNNATAIGYGAIVQGSDLVQLGDANVTEVNCWSGDYFATSDARFKTNVNDQDVKGLDFIKRLRPVVYNMDTRKLTEHITQNLPDNVRGEHLDQDFTASTAIRHSGFIAQEVEAAAKASGYNFHGVHVPQSGDGHYSLAYSAFVVPMVKAMQEQQQMIEALQQEIRILKSERVGATAVEVNSADNSALLEQNVPNPFTGETVISYRLPENVTDARMMVYDLGGKQVARFALTGRGVSSIKVSAESLSPGIYIYSIIADGKLLDSKRMVVSEK